MTDSIRDAIEAADARRLKELIGAEPALKDNDVRWGENGKNAVPPLHFVCDAVFRRLATEGQALAMANVLLEAGVDPDRVYAKSGDTFLIAAASLGAESVGMRLVEQGVDLARRGLFKATALHWAAYMGLESLTLALIEAGAELELTDQQYDCTPLEWALHGWTDSSPGRRERLPPVVRALREAGAKVPGDALGALTRDGDEVMRAALQ